MTYIIKNFNDIPLSGSESLFSLNQSHSNIKLKMANGYYVYRVKSSLINGDELYRMLHFFSCLAQKYRHPVSLPIMLDLRGARFTDKLTYIVLEIICAWELYLGHKVSLMLDHQKGITIDGFNYSPLRCLMTNSSSSRSDFFRSFDRGISLKHYRRIIRNNRVFDNTFSLIYTDVRNFFVNLHFDKECSDEIAEVVVELIGNAIEHCSSDCLLDVDVTNQYSKRVASLGKYLGVNIAIVNFSDTLLGDAVSNKMKIANSSFNYAYARLNEALKTHQQEFSSNYDIEDFFMLSSFQNGISGRTIEASTGGTGLTTLIQSLQSRSDCDSCYVLTGKHVAYFIKDLLSMDEHCWVGFNKFKDFVQHPPEDGVITRSNVFFPGTAYNLNFVMEETIDEK